MEKVLVVDLSIDEADETGVDFIAMVDFPAIERNWMAFNKQKQKYQVENKEQRIVSGPLMIPNLPIFRVDDFGKPFYVQFSKDTVMKIALKFAKSGFQNNVNLMHETAVDGVVLFESFIIDHTRGIKAPKGFEDLADGTWFGSMKVESDDVWAKVLSGEFRGFSVEGLFAEDLNRVAEEATIERIRNLFNDASLGEDELFEAIKNELKVVND